MMLNMIIDELSQISNHKQSGMQEYRLNEREGAINGLRVG